MDWFNTASPVIRSIINDLDGSTYTDPQLLTYVLSSAYLVQGDVTLVNDYTINFGAKTITPDPKSDAGYMNLMILKTVTIIALGEYKLSIAQGVRITDGPSTIDLTSRTETSKKLYDDMKKAYEQAALEYALGVNNPGAAVLSPYTVEG